MIIDGFEYGIILFFDDENGEIKYDYFFNNFDEFSRFMDNNCLNPQYEDLEANYSIVEIIDGEPEPMCWSERIVMVGLVEGEADDMIDDFRYWRDNNELLKDEFNQPTLITPNTKEISKTDYIQKEKWKNEFKYICPQCLNELEECTCRYYPYYLIQIDESMLPIIRELNKKGYITTACCGSHPFVEGLGALNIYIAFKDRYDFTEPYPQGGRYNREGVLSYNLPEKASVEELEQFKQNTINKLFEWAVCLPNNI